MLVNVIGAGLAGCEAAYFLANKGIKVRLFEMKPIRLSPAHSYNGFAELVCSNSLKSNLPDTSSGVLKSEMRLLRSLVIEAADATCVPAGGALAVDRTKFSDYITAKIRAHENIEVISKEVTDIPAEPTIIATGPLTSGAFFDALSKLTGNNLYFYDAAAPIISGASVDMSSAFISSRYNKGDSDYLNCPLDREQYYTFIEQLISAERANVSSEDIKVYESCMPIEIMAARGKDTLRFGPFKPVGLVDESGKRPYAVLQLRRENTEASLYNLVGCQTNLRFKEQERVFRLIPALKSAEFIKYGVMHRNSYLDAPKCLDNLKVRGAEHLYVAGQLCGVEGYCESALLGIIAGMNLLRDILGKPSVSFSINTITGSLLNYLSLPNKNFQPMNANFGILPPLHGVKKEFRRQLYASRAIEAMEQDIKGNLD